MSRDSCRDKNRPLISVQNRHKPDIKPALRTVLRGRHLSFMADAPYTLDQILDLLDRFHQRATYSAVAELINRPAQYLMSARPRPAPFVDGGSSDMATDRILQGPHPP